MADETPTAKPDRAAERAAARGTQSSPDRVPEEVRYTVDDLRENPRLLGPNITEPAIAGALFGATKKTWTLDEVRGRLDEFLTREHDV